MRDDDPAKRDKRDRTADDRLSIPLDPEEALRALLAVDPDDEPAAADAGPANSQKRDRQERDQRPPIR